MEFAHQTYPQPGREPHVFIDMRAKRRPIPMDPPAFSGKAIVGGWITTGLNSDPSKPWIKVDLTSDPPSVTQEAEYTGPAGRFPDSEEWYEKATTYGDIHITRF